jgi:hypothetical protein
MSWHYSQALVEEFSAESSSDGEPFAPWKSIPSVPDDSCSAKMKDTCHRSPFGMMFVPSTDAHGQDLLTSFLEASHARTSAQQGRAQESTGNTLGCGANSLGSLAKYDPRTSSWRTRQCSLVEGLDAFSETWPRWGLMRAGECWELPTREPHTSATESGLLPTLTASAYGSNQGGAMGRVGKVRLSLQAMASKGILPTLAVHGNYNRKGSSPQSGDGLATALAKLPTLRRTDGERGGRGDLIQALRGNENSHFMMPTLTAHDRKGSGATSGKNAEGSGTLTESVGGPLNPDWCEWFMGWPIGWTASARLETAKFQQWLDLHGRR